MTAEVVVMNKGAVALAADSAVSIGSRKVYNSANKLFALSRTSPVGVMIYGGAEFMDVPWETLIKDYRSELGPRSFPTLDGYAQNFLTYLKDRCPHFSSKVEAAYIAGVIRSFVGQMIVSKFKDAVKQKLQSNPSIAQSEVDSILQETISGCHEQCKKAKRLDHLPAKFDVTVRKHVTPVLDALLPKLFERVSVSAKQKTLLIEIAVTLFTSNRFPEGISGLVIAGFGQDEVFPQVLAYRVEAKILGELKYEFDKGRSHKINEDVGAAIIPFAQVDVVRTFLEGVDPDFAKVSSTLIQSIRKGLPKVIASQVHASNKKKAQALEQALTSPIDEIFKAYANELAKHISSRNVQPIVEMVGVLPKDELASMAEALVNLTSFKRKVTAVPESVGGPVDVAVISKGDGFIWIRRKHYFRPELNPHFFASHHGGRT